jgi:aryl-alcohol dehydrogenase-like predicted oxidoreductase
MQYTTLGNTGLVVSRLSFGAMTFTAGNKSFAAVYKTEAEAANAMIGKALDAGINFFDTADAYAGGESETMLGRALKSRRAEVVITTKVGNRTGPGLVQSGLSRRHILWSIDQSLRRLDTDFVDCYIAHKEDPYTPLEETLAALDEVVRLGKARYIGFSNWAAWRVAAAMELQKANGWAPFTHGQMHYSLLIRDVERDIVPMMQRYGLGLTVWSPLVSGFLSGKYTKENLSDKDNRMSGFDIMPFDKDAGFRLVDRLREIATGHVVGAGGGSGSGSGGGDVVAAQGTSGGHGAASGSKASVAQVAIAWLLAKKVVSSVIVGASKLSQLEDNLAASDLRLSADEIAALDEITKPAAVYPNWFSELVVDGPVKETLKEKGRPELFGRLQIFINGETYEFACKFVLIFSTKDTGTPTSEAIFSAENSVFARSTFTAFSRPFFSPSSMPSSRLHSATCSKMSMVFFLSVILSISSLNLRLYSGSSNRT